MCFRRIQPEDILGIHTNTQMSEGLMTDAGVHVEAGIYLFALYSRSGRLFYLCVCVHVLEVNSTALCPFVFSL